jgi:hypothetical protein
MDDLKPVHPLDYATPQQKPTGRHAALFGVLGMIIYGIPATLFVLEIFACLFTDKEADFTGAIGGAFWASLLPGGLLHRLGRLRTSAESMSPANEGRLYSSVGSAVRTIEHMGPHGGPYINSNADVRLLE